MVISNVVIKNFRGIEEKDIEFKPGFNLVKGINGKGKTSILEAVAIGLGGFITGVGYETRHFMEDDVRREFKKTGKGSYDIIHHTPISVAITAKIGQKEYYWERKRKNHQVSRTTTQPKEIIRLAETKRNTDNQESPVLIYMSTGRIWTKKKDRVRKSDGEKYYRPSGYLDALINEANNKFLLDWCIRMEQISWQNDEEITEYEAAKNTVAKFISYMNDGKVCKVFYDKRQDEMMYSCEDGIYAISDLSAGYQSIIWMAFDIAVRMAILNPDKLEHIAETSGVVLIDEIDMHLHPKWQWNVIGALRTIFPNVQFIAATHSPILFASAKDVWLIDMDEDEIKSENVRKSTRKV